MTKISKLLGDYGQQFWLMNQKGQKTNKLTRETRLKLFQQIKDGIKSDDPNIAETYILTKLEDLFHAPNKLKKG